MPSNKENSSRSSKGKMQMRRLEGENNEDYISRRMKNNEAVRKSRDKSKKKTEETLQRVNILKMENYRLEEQIKVYQKQLAGLKEIFLAHAGTGNMNLDIDFDAILKDADLESEEPGMILGS